MNTQIWNTLYEIDTGVGMNQQDEPELTPEQMRKEGFVQCQACGFWFTGDWGACYQCHPELLRKVEWISTRPAGERP